MSYFSLKRGKKLSDECLCVNILDVILNIFSVSKRS